jgi:hypothetical protein
MNDRLIQSQKRLHDSLFELYMQGGLELYLAGTRGLKRELIIKLETNWTCNGFAPVTYLIMPPLLRTPAG